VKKSEIRFKLRFDNGPVNPLLKNLVGKVEDVISPIMGLEFFPLLRPKLLW
jgi:hypothetical protein